MKKNSIEGVAQIRWFQDPFGLMFVVELAVDGHRHTVWSFGPMMKAEGAWKVSLRKLRRLGFEGLAEELMRIPDRWLPRGDTPRNGLLALERAIRDRMGPGPTYQHEYPPMRQQG